MAKCFRRAIILFALVWMPCISRGASSKDIDAAIYKATRYLYRAEKQGNWEKFREQKGFKTLPDQAGNLSATCLYAQLLAGESPDNPRIRQAVDYLLKNPDPSVVATGMRCHVWELLRDSPEIKAALRRDQQMLLRGFHYDSGFFDFDLSDPTVLADPSFTQYGVEGLWASANGGIEIPTQFWRSVDANWREAQHEDGSWFFAKDPSNPKGGWKPATTIKIQSGDIVDAYQTTYGKAAIFATTSSAIASLYMAQDQLNVGISPGCEGNLTEPEIDRGMDWLQGHFQDIFTSRSRYATLFGIEQIGGASGRKYLGSTDWFQQGADYLLRTQKPNGCWEWDPGTSALAVIFMTRGGAPIGFNKLQYYADPDHPEAAGNWNQRPRDLANLDNWITAQAELDRLLNWQVVSLDAPVEDLHDAAILYITGDKALNFSPEHKMKIAEFIEQGGMVLFNADCGSTEFADSAKALAAELFPRIGEFRELPADHPILAGEQFLARDWKEPPVVLGLSNGVRELMILLPKADPSRSWQAQLSSSRSSDFELGANILLYASDKKNIRSKGDPYIVEASSKITATRSLKVGRIEYDGNWDPEPGGWKRLAAVMHNRDRLDLEVTPVQLGQDTVLDGYKVLHLTGTGHVKIDPSDWAQIRTFVEGGGTLIVDAAGGSTTFADDVRQQLNSTFFENSEQFDRPVGLTDALYTDIAPRIDEVNYRAFARHQLMENLKEPRIRALKVADRAAVFLSNEDLSAGLVGEPVDGIMGYDPDSATNLMEHMILYAESGGKPVDATPQASGN
jgi:hypothetical protein